MRALYALVVPVLLASSGFVTAGYIDDNTTFSLAISVLRGAVGPHARALRIEADVNGIEIHAQDAHNRSHINGWRYGTVTYMGVPLRRLTGPEPIDPALVNPDIEANLFDLDSIDFAATPKLIHDSIARANLQDPAAVTRMEIARRSFILPQPTSGEVRWTVHVDSGREQADIFADAQGAIVGADVSGTQRAKTLNILNEPGLAAEAAAAFRDGFSGDRVLTSVAIEKKTMSFSTNIGDKSLGKLVTNMPVTATFTRDLNGLQRRLGAIDINATMGAPPPAAFAIADVDWAILGKLEERAIDKAAVLHGLVNRVSVAISADQPAGPVLIWTVEVTDPTGEVTKSLLMRRGPLPASYCRSRAVPKSIGGSRQRLPARLGEWKRFSARLRRLRRSSLITNKLASRSRILRMADSRRRSNFRPMASVARQLSSRSIRWDRALTPETCRR